MNARHATFLIALLAMGIGLPSDAAPNIRQRSTPTRTSSIEINNPQANIASKLELAYTQLCRNELDAASASYQHLLTADPNNTDALLALAAIRWQQGRFAEANRLREQAFTANPSDIDVLAAFLAGAYGAVAPEQAESRVRALLTEHPDAGPLYFALGNLMARKTQWSDAQYAYANAVLADGDNPDYLYNFAVTLDRTHAVAKAAREYRRALDARRFRASAFDPALVHKRLQEIDP